MSKYIVDVDKIKENIEKVRNAFCKKNIELWLNYSYKTNSMKPVIKTMIDNYVIPEVVSYKEYYAVKEIYHEYGLIVNGVSMNYNEIAIAITNGDLVNFNDVTSIEEVGKLVKGVNDIGIRVGDDGSRFGIKRKDFANALNVARSNDFNVVCVSCHFSHTREKKKYEEKVKFLIDLIIENGIRPKYIDFGGNMYGEMPLCLKKCFDDVCSFDDYADVISSQIKRLDYEPTVVLELGTALIANAVSLLTKVVRVDEYNRVVVDCDKFTIGGVVEKEFPIKFIDISNKDVTEFNIYGASCMEDDVIARNVVYNLPRVGDSLEFGCVGAYSHCLEPSDFIVERAEVEVR